MLDVTTRKSRGFFDGMIRAHPGVHQTHLSERSIIMLRWALGFFVLALIAAFFGFGGIAAGAAGIGKILFVGFLILAVVGLVAGLLSPKSSV